MKQETSTLIQNIRDIYIYLNINLSLYLKMEKIKEPVTDLFNIFNSDVMDKYLAYSAKLENIRNNTINSGGADFTGQHNFMIANEQKIYGKNRIVEEIQSEIQERKKSNKSVHIVSLGIGNGETTERYAPEAMLDKNDIITGIDMHDSYMDAARHRITGLKTFVFDFNELSPDNLLPLDDNSADIIECTMVAHHIENIDFLFKEVARILKNKGIFYYVDLVDKTHRNPMMVFSEDHEYPPFHGAEFYRKHEYLSALLNQVLSVKSNRRIGPGYALISAEK